MGEEYVLTKIRESFHTSIHKCKALMLTAKSMFPKNFDIQYEAYLIEKRSKNVQNAAKCFSMLFQSFVSESGLWEEVSSLTSALGEANPSTSQAFLKEMFTHISANIQHDILTVTAERSEDTMEHCRLMLILFKKFPKSPSTPQLMGRLAETLLTAEKHKHCQTATNCYRTTLVREVMPLLLSSDIELPSKQLCRLMHKSVEFYLTLLMPQGAKDNVNAVGESHAYLWDTFFELLRFFGEKLNWEVFSVFKPPITRDVIEKWKQIMSFAKSANQDAGNNKNIYKQMTYALTFVFSFSMYQYNLFLHGECNDRSAVILMDASLFNEEEDSSSVPIKKARLEEGCPLITGEEPEDYSKHFYFGVQCWDWFHSCDVLQKEFLKLKQHVRLELWVGDFVFDYALFRGKVEEMKNAAATFQFGGKTLRHALQALNYNLTVNSNMLRAQCIHVIHHLQNLHAGKPSKVLCQPQPDQNKRLHYLPLKKIPILQYVCKILMKNFADFRVGMDVDRTMALILVLCQLNWPAESAVAVRLLNGIREKGSFSFPSLTTYVSNEELLEEFLYMCTHERHNIHLDILPNGHASKQRIKATTRHNGRESNHDLREIMTRRMNDSQPLHTLIVNFLLSEEKFILLSTG